MLEVSESALAQLQEMLASEGSSASAIRITVMGGGANSSGVGLIVDEPKDDDVQYIAGEVPFIIDRQLIEYCKSVSIDFRTGKGGTCGGSSGSGFLITTGNPINF